MLRAPLNAALHRLGRRCGGAAATRRMPPCGRHRSPLGEFGGTLTQGDSNPVPPLFPTLGSQGEARWSSSSPRRRRRSASGVSDVSFDDSTATVMVLPSNLKIDPRSSFAAKSTGSTQSKKAVKSPDTQKTSGKAGDASLESERHPKPSRVIGVEDPDLEGDEDYEYDDDEYKKDDLEYPLYLKTPEVKYAVPLPERLNVQVHTLFAAPADPDAESSSSSSLTGTLWLEDSVFGRDPIRIDLLKRAVDYFRAKKRGRRKAVTKTIGQVSGSGRKRRQQKGTGHARMGHARPPHHRGGAKAHGPKNVTDYGRTKLNKKVRKLALCHALSQKLLEGNLIVLNSLWELPTHKTKELARLLLPWKIGGRNGATALILDSYYRRTSTTDEDAASDDSTARVSGGQERPASFRGVPANLVVASANLPNITVGSDHDGSVYEILRHEKLVLTLAAVAQLESRLNNI